MERDIFDSIKEKDFDQLNEVEKSEVLEMCNSEEEFYNLKNVLLEVEGAKIVNPAPSEKVKDNLNDLFDQVHGSPSRPWFASFGLIILPREEPIYKQPLMYAALLILALLLFVPNNNDSFKTKSETPVVAELSKSESNKKEIPNVESRSEIQDEKELLSAELADDPMPIDDESFEGGTSFNGTTLPGIAANATSSGVFTSDHPDGIFMGDIEDLSTVTAEVHLSIPVSEEPAVLDLLVATF